MLPPPERFHHHGATFGAASPAQRRLEAYGRAYVLAKYRVPRSGLLMRLEIAVLDWPVLVVHALVRRELAPLRARAAGRRDGLAVPALRAPLELATVGFREAIGRQASLLQLRFRGGATTAFPRARAAESQLVRPLTTRSVRRVAIRPASS